MNVVIPLFPLPPAYDNASTQWAHPDRSATGDQQEAPLHLAVGVALSRWELAEMFLAELFELLVESESWAAARAYGIATGPATRRPMLQAASEVYFDDPRTRPHDKAVMAILLKNYIEGSGRRNDVAHGVVTYIQTGRQPPLGHFLMPPDYNTRRTKRRAPIEHFWRGKGWSVTGGYVVFRNERYLERATYALTSSDIKSFAAKVEEFAAVTAQFVNNLRVVRQHGPG